MTTAVLKKELHAYIEKLNKEKLEAIYTLVAEPEAEYELTEEQLEILEERRKAHKTGKSKSYTVAEVRKHILARLKK